MGLAKEKILGISFLLRSFPNLETLKTKTIVIEKKEKTKRENKNNKIFFPTKVRGVKQMPTFQNPAYWTEFSYDLNTIEAGRDSQKFLNLLGSVFLMRVKAQVNQIRVLLKDLDDLYS